MNQRAPSPRRRGQPRLGGKFLAVTPVTVPGTALSDICNAAEGYAQSSPMCAFYSSSPFARNDGVLVYGTGRPYGRTPLFLGYIKATEVGLLNSQGRPLVYYFNGNITSNPHDSWSNDEDDAAPLPRSYWGVSPISDNLPCDEHREITYTFGDYLQDLREQGSVPYTDAEIHAMGHGFDCFTTNAPHGGGNNYSFSPESCMPAYAFTSDDPDLRIRDFENAAANMIGMMSAKLVEWVPDAENPETLHRFYPRIVMLYNRYPSADNIYFNSVPLAAPWEIGFGIDNGEFPHNHDGYGPFILEQYTRYDSSNEKLVLWHTMSSWWGPPGNPPRFNYNEHPYGVYTTSTAGEWPFETREVLP